MRRRYHLRLGFWIYCLLTLLLALVAVNTAHNLLFWVFGVMASALLISGVVSGVMMMGLEVRRIIPAHGAVDEVVTIRYEIHNRNRLFPAFNVHFEERLFDGGDGWQRLMEPAPAWVMHVGPGDTVHGEAIFRPARRGLARFDQLRIATTFPFGIVRKSITSSQPQYMLVYPRLFALRRRVLDAVAPAGAIGTKVTDRAGSGDDYFGLREFRPGDSMRHIAWKRTANRDELVCIERAHPTPPKLRVLLNLLRPTDQLTVGKGETIAARELEERAISLAASIIHAADLAGFEIGLTILGVPVPPMPVRRSHWHRNRMMAALAAIDLDAPRHRSSERVVSDLEQAGLIVVHPDRSDPSVVRGEAWHFNARQLAHLVELPGEFADRSIAAGPSLARTEAAA
jgi:uncharacterized protein (DUF58 family)